MSTLTESCRCGATLTASDRSIVMLGYRQQAFLDAHSVCRVPVLRCAEDGGCEKPAVDDDWYCAEHMGRP